MLKFVKDSQHIDSVHGIEKTNVGNGNVMFNENTWRDRMEHMLDVMANMASIMKNHQYLKIHALYVTPILTTHVRESEL